MLALPLVVIVLVWYLLICYKWKKTVFNSIEKIPGMTFYPIVGTTYPYIGGTRNNMLYRFIDHVGKYKPLFRSWYGHTPEIHVMKPEHLQIIMRSSSHTTKGPFYDNLFPWLGEGVFISEGAKWFMQRKLLTPTFHFKILEGFLDVFVAKTAKFMNILESKADGKYFNVADNVAECTLGIICETAMGVPLKEITDKPLKYVQDVTDITELVMWRYWRPYVIDPIFHLLPQGKRYRQLVRDLHDFSSKVISLKKEQKLRRDKPTIVATTEEGDKKLSSFLDLIIDCSEDQNVVNDADLQSMVDTFLFAGYDTTSNTLSWALFLLGNYPDIQEKAYEEVMSVLQDKPSPTNMADLNELKYIECVVKETLRLFPVLPMVARRLTEDTQIGEYKIPAGTQALLHIRQAHTDPDHYPDPTRFDPDRFLPENTKNRHPFAFIPFSAGPRNCLGSKFALLELKLALATFIKKFRVVSLETQAEIKLFSSILIRPQDGINVKLELREE